MTLKATNPERWDTLSMANQKGRAMRALFKKKIYPQPSFVMLCGVSSSCQLYMALFEFSDVWILIVPSAFGLVSEHWLPFNLSSLQDTCCLNGLMIAREPKPEDMRKRSPTPLELNGWKTAICLQKTCKIDSSCMKSSSDSMLFFEN